MAAERNPNLAPDFASVLSRLIGADPRERRYVLAVSGGADSMTLLQLMADLVPAKNLAVAHFNHRLRGKASLGDERLVKREAARRGLAFYRARGQSGARSEAALRRERRAFLKDVRERAAADFIVLAHHADDQLETFLMRLVRGTGLDGLGGMAPRRGPWLRPLLEVSRAEIRAFAHENALPFREDETNRLPTYFRNRVRHKLLPALAELSGEFGGQDAFLDRFGKTLAEIREESRRLRRRARRFLDRHGAETPFWLWMVRAPFLELGESMQARVVRAIYRRLGRKPPDRGTVTFILHAIGRGEKGRSLPGGIELRISCGVMFFQTPRQRRRGAEPLALTRDGSSLSCERLGLCFRLSASIADLEARFPRPGDRYRGEKLKRRLLERRIPAPERSLLPVLARSGSSEVLWFFPEADEGVALETSRFAFSFGAGRQGMGRQPKI